jgi:hypothetical protein
MQSELLATANDSFHMSRDIVWLWDGGHESDLLFTGQSNTGNSGVAFYYLCLLHDLLSVL